MTEHIARHLHKARKLLALAQALLSDGYVNDAAHDAYLAVYHAAQAYIVHRTGVAAKGESGVNTQFAHLTLGQPRIDLRMQKLLPAAYELKNAADYELGDKAVISNERVVETVALAAQFIERIASLLTHPPNPESERSDAPLR